MRFDNVSCVENDFHTDKLFMKLIQRHVIADYLLQYFYNRKLILIFFCRRQLQDTVSEKNKFQQQNGSYLQAIKDLENR